MLLTGAVGMGVATPAHAATTASSASDVAAAIAVDPSIITAASFVTQPSAVSSGVSDDALGQFPRHGSTFGVLSSGDVTAVPVPDTFASVPLAGASFRGDTDLDVTILKVDLNVPQAANCLSLDFKFLSEEYPSYVGTSYNDAFIAELDQSTWTTTGSTISAPDNFAFDASNDVVSINSTGVGGMTTAEGAGTAFDGGPTDTNGAATTLLSAAKQVTGGAHSLYLSIFDQGDQILDSAVFLDNLRVGYVPNPATNCVSGAQVVTHSMTLTPATGSGSVGGQHTVTATVTDSEGDPDQGGTVEFTVNGANSATGSDTTDASGQATFSYTGAAAGDDTISACFKPAGETVCAATASVAFTWTAVVNQPPTVDAGGPYSGVEGAAVAITGVGQDPAGESLTYLWTYTKDPAVDAGATCSFANANAASTTVTCTDDGAFTLTLTTSDGTNADVSDNAGLTVTNAAPAVSITSPATMSQVKVGSDTTVTAAFTDAGSNDTHTCTVDWGDGSTSPGTVNSGACTATHAYTALGVYEVTVTVTDDDDASGNASLDLVAYDQEVKVNGGGFMVPSGGRVSFGFVAKSAGAGFEGQLQVRVTSTKDRFHGNAVDSLTVAGKTAEWSGTGSWNGEDGYTFVASVVDNGQGKKSPADSFSLTIKDGGGGVVYTASGLLKGGNLTIH